MGKRVRKKTAVFVDYESWYYGLYNLYGEKPNVKKILGDIEKEDDVVLKKGFGNLPVFSGVEKEEKEKLGEFGYDLEYTFEGNTKDNLTDFVVVDYIYRMLLEDRDNVIEKVILISGDSHYIQVLRTLKDFGKEVEVRAVKGTISRMFDEFTVKPIIPEYSKQVRSLIEEEMFIIEALVKVVSEKELIKRVLGKCEGTNKKEVKEEIKAMIKEGRLVKSNIKTNKTNSLSSVVSVAV